MSKFAVTIEGGWLAIVEATNEREAERKARRDWSYGLDIRPSEVEALARPATDEDIQWHLAMGGHG